MAKSTQAEQAPVGRKPRGPNRTTFLPPATLDDEIKAVSEKTGVPIPKLRGYVQAEAATLLAGLRGKVLEIYARAVGLSAGSPVAEYKRDFNHGTGETGLSVLPADEPAS